MAIIAFTRNDAIAGDGHIYLQSQSGGAFEELTLPVTVSGARVRPVRLKYKGRVYVFGMFSTPVVITESRRIWSMGIPAPETQAPMTLGTSSGGSVGEAIGYITFLEKDAGKIIQESNPSLPSATVSLNGEGRSWTSLPTSCINPRVTHIRGYVSMDGSVPGLAWERQLGVTTVNENVSTGRLGERLPVSVGLDGDVDVQIYDRGVPPNGRFAEVYHDAMWISGEYDHPTRVYYSKLFEPESFNTVDKDRGWFETLDGEAVTGLQRWGDLLIVGCLRACYAIQGFDSGDYQMIKISNYYGVISHHSMVRVGPNADLWAASQEGVWMFDGQFHDLFEDDLREYWRSNYQALTIQYEDCFAGEDRFFRTYQLAIPPASGSGTFKYICHWRPVVRENAAPWVIWDVKARTDASIGSAITGNDDHYGTLLSGSCDGYIRKENVLTDTNDDGDSYQKAMTVITKHFYMGDQGGDWAHARDYVNLDVFIKNPNTAVAVSAYGGDDTAIDAAAPQWSRTISAGAVTSPKPRVPVTSTSFPVSECNGRGVSLKFTASAPINVSLRGFTIYHILGEQAQLASS